MDVSRWRPPERVQGTLVQNTSWCFHNEDEESKLSLGLIQGWDRQRWKYHCWHHCKKNHANTVNVCMFLLLWTLCFFFLICSYLSQRWEWWWWWWCPFVGWKVITQPLTIDHLTSDPDRQKVWLTVFHLNFSLCSKKPTSAYCYYSRSPS